MKKYITPTLDRIEIYKADVITTSPGTETPRYDESDGIWELDISN